MKDNLKMGFFTNRKFKTRPVYKYNTKFATKLSKCEGVLKPESAKSHFGFEDVVFDHLTAWRAFDNSILFNRKKRIRVALLPSVFECNVSFCQRQDERETKNLMCYKSCLSHTMSRLKRLSQTDFFDLSGIQKSMENNISRCEI